MAHPHALQHRTPRGAVIAFLDSHKVGQADMIRQAAELRRASIVRDVGTTVGITERLAAHGLPADICGVADKPPSIPPSAIPLTSEDYPKDLIRRDVTGLTAIELSVSATGKIDGARVIASQPSGLFDAVAAAKLSSVTLLPAQRNSTPFPVAAWSRTSGGKCHSTETFRSRLWGFLFRMSD